MKLLHLYLIIALICLSDASKAKALSPTNEVCQFDKSTMIKQKFKKAQECINEGKYTAAIGYLNGILKLEPNNAKAKELIAICKNGGNSSSIGSSNSRTFNGNNSYGTSLSVSKSNLSFSSSGGTETINVYGSIWSISVNPASWVHLRKSVNSLILQVDANTSTMSRTDYFKLKAGSQEVRINITQSGSQYSNTTYLKVSKSEMYFSSDGGQESITISTNNIWKITTNTYSWGHLKQEGNTLTLSVDANYSGLQRTDYFKLKAGSVEKRINVTQSPRYSTNGVAMYGSTRAYIDNAEGLTNLTTCIGNWKKCQFGALTEYGTGLVIHGGNGYATAGNLNSTFLTKLKDLNNKKETFKSVSITNSGYYCIVYGRNGWYGNVPTTMRTDLERFNKNKEQIYCVSIAENGDYIIITDKHVEASNATDMSNLRKAGEKYGHLKYACVTNKGLIVVCQNGIFYNNIPTNLEVKLKSIKFRPDKISFTDSGTYLITNEDETFTYYM